MKSIFIVLVFFVSCTMRNTRPLIGKWQVIVLKDEFTDIDFRNKEIKEEKLFAHFINDSTYVTKSARRVDTMNYRINGDTILFQKDRYVYTYRVTRDSLFLNGPDNKHQSILVRVR